MRKKVLTGFNPYLFQTPKSKKEYVKKIRKE